MGFADGKMRGVIVVVMVMMFLFSCKSTRKPHETIAVEPALPAVLFADALLSDELIARCPGRVMPLKYRVMRVNYTALREKLHATRESPPVSKSDTLLFDIPLPTGGSQSFRISLSSTLSPELAAKYPEIKAWYGAATNRPSDQVRLEITPKGFTSMILSEQGSLMIDPLCPDDSQFVIVYNKNDLPPDTKEPFEK